MPHADDESDEANALRTTAKRTVMRWLAELREAGAIEVTRRGCLGRRAEYRINLTPVDKSKYR